MKSIFIKSLQIFSSIYAVLYFIIFALPILKGVYSDDSLEKITVLIMFLIFVVALYYSWKKPSLGGLFFLVWFTGIIILSNSIWLDAGMAVFLSVPMLIVGMLLFIFGYN